MNYGQLITVVRKIPVMFGIRDGYHTLYRTKVK